VRVRKGKGEGEKKREKERERLQIHERRIARARERARETGTETEMETEMETETETETETGTETEKATEKATETATEKEIDTETLRYSLLHSKYHSIDSPISISLVSFHRNVANDTWRIRSQNENGNRRNDTPIAIGCTEMPEIYGFEVERTRGREDRQERRKVNTMDNFSHESDVTSLQDLSTSCA